MLTSAAMEREAIVTGDSAVAVACCATPQPARGAAHSIATTHVHGRRRPGIGLPLKDPNRTPRGLYYSLSRAGMLSLFVPPICRKLLDFSGVTQSRTRRQPPSAMRQAVP